MINNYIGDMLHYIICVIAIMQGEGGDSGA